MAEEAAASDRYDVAIVGAGLTGAILAGELGRRGWRVLVLEAGVGTAGEFPGYLSDVQRYLGALAKVPNSAYRLNPDAPQPDVLDITTISPGHPDTKGYFVQEGPLPYGSDYVRALGGTMLHWLGTSLRMLPEDFDTASRFGAGLDWPIGYDDLVEDYARAEREMGVAGDVADQAYLGIWFPEGYVYPMHRIPPSYLDQVLTQGLDGMTVRFGGEAYPIVVTSTPQGRNGMPNPAYDGGSGYQPVGAAGEPSLGLRCAGNSACIPICPIQAKYSSLKTLAKADRRRVSIQPQSVASGVEVDAAGTVTAIEYRAYTDPGSPRHEVRRAHADLYVLAAHAIENAKILLASGLPSSSGLVGKNLMDHPVVQFWGLMPGDVGAYRGPGSTSGIESLRGGPFRRDRAGFRIEIGNWGWNWSEGDPTGMVDRLVDQSNLFGRALRARMASEAPRQFELHVLIDQMPDPANRVTIDPAYKDQIGNYRPVLHYDLTGYEKLGVAASAQAVRLMFQRLGVEDFTSYDPSSPGYFTVDGQGFEYFGAGHGAGTHLMGTSAANSVVDSHQRSWDHPNLYLCGCGSMPTVGTSNPTLTMAALAFRSARAIDRDLQRLHEAAPAGEV